MRPLTAPADALDDRFLMAIGIPGFGLVIPFLVGLYGPLTWRDPIAWVGGLGFILLAALTWWGNRWLLFEQRKQWSWFRDPWRRLLVLVAGCVLYTGPLAALWIAGWYHLAGLPVDTGAIRTVALLNTICVLIVSHLYETLFLLRERIDDATRIERTERSRVQAQLDALRHQVDPHFLFNALNTLAWLIETRPDDALTFTEDLAEVYRYVLDHRDRDLVLLKDELAFAHRYADLLRIRFGDAVQLHVDPPSTDWLVPPISLQILLENAVKHNEFGDGRPLRVAVHVEGDQVVVRNAVRQRRTPPATTGLGLANLRERVELATHRHLEVRVDGARFEVRVPLLAVA